MDIDKELTQKNKEYQSKECLLFECILFDFVNIDKEILRSWS